VRNVAGRVWRGVWEEQGDQIGRFFAIRAILLENFSAGILIFGYFLCKKLRNYFDGNYLGYIFGAFAQSRQVTLQENVASQPFCNI
jgi:hypothetical protein